MKFPPVEQALHSIRKRLGNTVIPLSLLYQWAHAAGHASSVLGKTADDFSPGSLHSIAEPSYIS